MGTLLLPKLDAQTVAPLSCSSIMATTLGLMEWDSLHLAPSAAMAWMWSMTFTLSRNARVRDRFSRQVTATWTKTFQSALALLAPVFLETMNSEQRQRTYPMNLLNQGRACASSSRSARTMHIVCSTRA